MAHKYAQLAFTETVRRFQTEQNSRSAYASMDQGEDYNYLLSEQEATFIEARDSFYMASVSETDWPYVQHRGGPEGFMRVLDASTIGFADFKGNRQYVSAGNFRTNNRVSLFFMDYPNRRRLKLMGRIEQVADNDWETLAKLELSDYRASVERGFIIRIEAFDWNCPQHITPRFSEKQIESMLAPLIEENKSLKDKLGLLNRNVPLPNKTNQTHLGDGPLPLVISGIRQLTPRVRAYELRDPEGNQLPEVKAGAHIQVPVVNEDGEQEWRHYSICSNPKRRDIYEIAVLNEEAKADPSKDLSRFSGSEYIHANYQLGDSLNCQLPGNYFELKATKNKLILIAGGIGITPIKAMAQALKCQGKEFELHYAGRSKNQMAFVDRSEREFGEKLKLYQSDLDQRLDVEQLIMNNPKDTSYYVCGPQRLIDAVKQVAKERGIGADHIHYERFNAESDSEAKAFKVNLAKSEKLIEVASDQTILDVATSAGVEIAHSCKTGQCRTCVVKVVEGKVDHNDICLTESERENGLMCPCVSRAKSDKLVLDI